MAGSTGGKLVETAGARAVSLGLMAVATTLVMRTLGPAESGVYYVLITIATTAVALGHFSLSQAYVFFWTRGDDPRSLGANAVGLGLAGGCIAAFTAWTLVHLLGPNSVPVGGRYALLAAALLAVPPSIVMLYLSVLLALDDRIGRVNAVNLLGSLLPFCAIVVLHLTDRLTLTAAIVVWISLSVLPALGLVAAFGARRRHLSRSLALETLKVGCQYHIATISLFLLLRVDIFLLNAQVTRREVGLYALAAALAELTFIFTDSLAQVILPRQVAESFQEAGAYTAQIMRTSLVSSILIVAGILVAGPYLVPLVFGKEFRGSVGAMFSLAPGIVAFATIRTLGGVLIRLNRPLVVSSVTAAAMVLNIVLNLLLIPRWGIVGAGLASSLAYSLLALFHTLWLLRAASLPPSVLLPKLSDFTRPVAAITSRMLRRP
jgi:O-antigen/teichoic acid export membrane protein